MFRFTRKPSSGSHRQYLAKTTHLVQCGYIELLQDVISVMSAYFIYIYIDIQGVPGGMCQTLGGRSLR